ncbi:MAG: hypothetical protein Q8S96_18890, partial [Hydrogenophaga sp.]|uniref:hypothetical protein n=1 Tax=Hydrogenophaga sp. TaxID=1904254 RepID=UPI0027339BB3
RQEPPVQQSQSTGPGLCLIPSRPDRSGQQPGPAKVCRLKTVRCQQKTKKPPSGGFFVGAPSMRVNKKGRQE